MPKVLKIILITLVFIILLPTLSIFIFPQIIPFVVSRTYLMQPKYKSLTVMPIFRIVTPVKNLYEYSDYGFENITFKLPWKEVKKGGNDQILSLSTTDGKRVIVMPSSQIPSSVKSFTNSKPEELKKLQSIFGINTLSSDYEFEKAMLFSSPKQVSLLDSSEKATAIMILSTLKGVLTFLGTPENGIYIYEVNDLRAFQLGDPLKGNIVSVKFYDSKDKPHEFGFKNLTQEEIDFILYSVNVD